MELTLDQALQKGIEAHKAGKAQEADRYYTAILKADPKHPDANHNMGVLAVGVGKVEAALPFFKTALEANSSIAQFWLSYIEALVKLDRIDDANAVFDQAKSKGIKGNGFDQLKRQLKSVTSKNSTAQEPSRDEQQGLINLYTQGQYNETLTQASQLLRQFADSITLYSLIGAANQKQGKLDEAIEAYKKVLSIKPDYAEAHNNMGVALQDLHKLGEAMEAFNKALAIKPDYASAHNNMGNVLQKQGKLEAAIKAYKKAFSLKPDYPEAHYNMGVVLKEQNKLEEAIEAYNNAIFIKPDYDEAYLNIGNALHGQGKLEEAIEAYNKAISINPGNASAYNNMGIVLQEQGKLKEAIEAYKKAITIKPDHAEVLVNLLYLQNQISDAELITIEFEKKLKIDSLALLEMPQFQIQKAVSAFLFNDPRLVQKYLRSYNDCTPSSIAKLKSKDQVFCSAYNRFLLKLTEISMDNDPAVFDNQTVFHLGESHCLSYAHTKIKIYGVDYTIAPRITFGAKSYHFSSEKKDAFKAITEANFNSLPDGSKVFLSFGEIDCRPNEGFISAAKKYKKPIENLVSDTISSYVNWFFKQNKSKNHSLFFFNIPAPNAIEKYTTEVNAKVSSTIQLFNSLLHKTVSDYSFNLIDVYKFTVGKGGFSNGLFHIDNHHISSDAIPEIEKQIGTFL